MPTPEIVGSWTPIGQNAAIPGKYSVPAGAGEQWGRGQFVTLDVATGYAALNDGTVPGQMTVGWADPAKLSDLGVTDGDARIRVSQRWAMNSPVSEAAGDGLDGTDIGAVFYVAAEGTAGKLAVEGGNSRSIGGIALGLDDRGQLLLWSSPIAWLLARATLAANSTLGGSYQVADAAAGDVTGEVAIERVAVGGVVTAVEFIGDDVTGDDTNNATISVFKRDGAGGASVSIATITTTATPDDNTITAFVPKSLTLSVVAGALNLLATDVLTLAITKAGTGAVLVGNIRVIQSVS